MEAAPFMSYITDSARRHGVDDEDMLHAFGTPVRFADADDGLVMVIGPSRSAALLEIGIVDTDEGPVIVHAMAARGKYMR